jgi:lipoprotein-anchoring transpeptidase ErfK/SrfK
VNFMHLGTNSGASRRVGLISLTAIALAACSSTSTAGSHGNASGQLAANYQPAHVSFLPADKAQGVAPDTVVTVAADSGALQTVNVHASGDTTPLAGTFSGNRRVWTATSGLLPGTQYVESAVAETGNGDATSAQGGFSTLSGDHLTTRANPGDGETVGVGMPIKLVFNTPIPAANEAALVSHIQVTSVPAQQGAWHWFSPIEVHYRPAVFWQPHTTVTVNANLQGVNAGNNTWGYGNWSETFTVGDSHISMIDHNTEMMTVSTNGQQVRTIPVALGKPGFPTLSGTLVVWYKSQSVMMDSCASGIDCTPGTPNYYKENVYWDTAISTDGFFIHDAYWDIFAQGHYDYSHGCVNISPDNAIWFFGYSQVGDVVEIANTARVGDAGDGEGDWQLPFAQYANSSGAAPPAPRQNGSGGV